MITIGTSSIRSLLSTRRPIDRPIEKVIDYYATEAKRLLAEVEEYEVTENVERNFRRFLEVFGTGVRTGQVVETGIWVSGFYGSGKSSFTKYLGFALDPTRVVEGRPFLDLLVERISASDVRQELKTIAAKHPVAVIMLDLGAEQLASSSVAAVSTVLYWKVLQWAGYSKEEKLAHLELRLDSEGRLDAFREAYKIQFGIDWEADHNDPLIGIARADQIVPQFFPKEFPVPGAFRSLHFSLAGDVRDRARETLDLIRRKTGRQNVLFLIDEAGQYVAPRGELILNLDGLARNFKELGQGLVWIVATGQQTLTEILERAAYNSAELTKLRDRFPISLELDARDIREITWKRLLTKSSEGESALVTLFRQHGQALAANTRLADTSLFKGDPNEETFVQLYPFLPQHFDLLMELVRTLARSTGGIGLRSAIRVIQDLLVDTSKVLLAGTPLLANMPFGHLATADQFFDTLRADIGKVLPHVITGVDRAARALSGDDLALRVAKTVGTLQPIENFPRTTENIAALLYQHIGDAPHVDAVRVALHRLLETKEVGLVDDPQSGGFTFLSEGVKPIRDKRNGYIPTRGELSQLRSQILRSLFDQLPSAILETAKTVRAGIQLSTVPITGEDEEVQFRLEVTESSGWDERRTLLLTETTGHTEWKSTIAWLIRPDMTVNDTLVEVVRSRKMVSEIIESQADKDIAQFIRSERAAATINEERVRVMFRQALLEGTLIFRGNPTAASVAGQTLEAAAHKVLQEAAGKIYPSFHLVNIRPGTDLAAKFLGVERIDRMPKEADPLGFISMSGGRPHVDIQHAALAEAIRAFREKLNHSGTTRLQGNAIQDIFATTPYGWSKDATRYVFAALLLAGEVIFHTSSGEVKTSGSTAIEAVRNTQAFGRIGVALRDSRPSNEMLDRAATRLEKLFGVQVLPLEDHISRAVREHLPSRLELTAPLAEQLRLLQLAGANRAQTLYEIGRDLLKQEGSAAISLMGAVECSFPEDMEWAKRVSKSLTDGADKDVSNARDVIREADDLSQLFPIVSLLEQSEQDVLADVLKSDSFYTRLADLRGVVRRVRDRTIQIYHEFYRDYEANLINAREELEALPEWLKIADEDRQEIGARLLNALTINPEDGQEIKQLQLLLVRQAAISGLLSQLQEEVERRIPKVVDEVPGTVNPVDLELSAIALPTLINSPDELEVWLDALRMAIAEALTAGAPIRIRIRR